jgi:hypothetical protein
MTTLRVIVALESWVSFTIFFPFINLIIILRRVVYPRTRHLLHQSVLGCPEFGSGSY